MTYSGLHRWKYRALLLFTLFPACLSHSQTVNPALIFETLYHTNELTGVTKSPYHSPVDIVVSPDEKTLYIAEHDTRCITVVPAVASAGITRRIYLPKHPTGLALSAHGDKLYVTCSSTLRPAGMVYVIDTESGAILNGFTAGHSARAPAVTPDGTQLFVCNRFSNSVSVYQIGTGSKRADIPVVREPYAATLTPDGSKLLVANLLPAGPSNVSFRQAVVSIIDTKRRVCDASVRLCNGAQSAFDICVSPDGKYAYVAHIRSNFTQTPLQPIIGGWTNANCFSIIDIQRGTLIYTVLLDDGQFGGAANPWAIACDERRLVVSTTASKELHIVDRIAMHAFLDSSGLVLLPEESAYDLTLSQRFTHRNAINSQGGRCCALIGNTVFLPDYFAETIDIFSIDADTISSFDRINLFSGHAPAPKTAIRSGEYYFHNAADMCLGKFHSCHSCHPFGRAAGLKWDMECDGNGNFKNDKSLLYAHLTPPMMWTGVRDSLGIATRKHIELVLFLSPSSREEQAQHIDAYISSLRAVPSPYLDKGRLSESASRGKQLFTSLGCTRCHPPESYLTDMKRHSGKIGADDIGPWDGNWDTPSLHEVWRTGPYIHDGRTMDMVELLNKYEESRGLTMQDVRDLAEYVNSL